ncbi:glycosyltransferase family 4 protein [Neptuniibacter pectenicola]|uniref:glycosyltransferase family 4 protein n=1 Tax=Neptuniibacter pectenicola TaxID=1806669 RepID=UPI0008297814|nr:glycosyltransferase family 4 protein [Neptuniibacter pectenicola]
MKVLYLNTLYAPEYGGGAEVTLKLLAESMQNSGHEVVVLTLSENDELIEEVIDGVRVIRAKLQNRFWHQYEEKPSVYDRALWHLQDIDNKRMARVLGEVLDKEKPDVVSCHNLIGWSSSSWEMIHNKGVPIVQVLHDLYNLCPNSTMFKNDSSCKKRCFKCKAFRYANPKKSEVVSAVVGVSEYILDTHLKYGVFGKAPIKINIKNIRNIDSGIIEPKESGVSITFGFIGALIKSKGIELLIEEFNKLKDENVDLVIAGKGEDEYVKYLHSISGGRIKFLGQVPPADFYNSVDLVVVPSLWNDTLPGVVFESFIFGKPVIGSDRGGIPEMITDGVNGFVFDPESDGQLLSLMNNIISNRKCLNELSNQANHSAAPFLDVEGWVKSYEDLYIKVINNSLKA